MWTAMRVHSSAAEKRWQHASRRTTTIRVNVRTHSDCNRDNLPHLSNYTTTSLLGTTSLMHLRLWYWNTEMHYAPILVQHRYKRMGCVPGSCKGRAQHTEKANKWRRYDYSIHHGTSSSSASSSSAASASASSSSDPFFRVAGENQVW